ncbi:nucleoside deaminase [Corynebacterium tuscaniense]|uniref:nucleoside deaminase n=1 Tax=Corynebacterium tuscaniense TaxID=302449 RepID=UPI001238416C|nr:nucleoside deaminase [Corynebacterium tuscaniense]
MRRAIEVARTTPPGDIPVGAVVYGPDGREVAAGTNRRECDRDPVGHAEIVAMRAAAEALGTWRLDGCELVVTLEPCTMCAGAVLGARVSSLVFGAYEPKTGAVGSLIDVLRDPTHLHTVEVRGGVLEAETAGLLAGFFERLR